MVSLSDLSISSVAPMEEQVSWDGCERVSSE